jgi:hypothetical protein
LDEKNETNVVVLLWFGRTISMWLVFKILNFDLNIFFPFKKTKTHPSETSRRLFNWKEKSRRYDSPKPTK